ncbi:S8 family serine peptidase [Acrocarpospora catenulata]|uniref:S8 family serine peptidase n=1 Tax=Acrocarpospora catenulata TaxID=2836182 RepID=UPI001BDABF56|nr:S8 family serine peptidase [Acrocarpospora catenulata]
MGAILVPAGTASGTTADPELVRAIEQLRDSGDFGPELEQYLADAAAAVEQDECAAAAALQSFADQVGQEKPSRAGNRLRGRVLGALADEKGCAGPITVYADPDTIKSSGPLNGYEPGAHRPVAALVDEDGRRTEFVADEVIVFTEEETELDKFVSRWDGKVLHRTDDGETPAYLVRITTDQAEPAKLGEHLSALNGEHQKATALAVSSQDGVNLLAAAAAEARDGLQVMVNWVTPPTGYADRTTMEAGVGVPDFSPNGMNYTRNAYEWSYLSNSGAQAIGTAEAWTVLDSIGLLDNKVEIGIVDKGYAPQVNADLPANPDMVTVVPFTDAGDPGQAGFEWHGTMVASTAAAVPNNYVGAAGPAGPVAKLNLVYADGSAYGVIVGVGAAKVMGSKIINMSFSTPVHWALAWSLLPLDGYLRYVRALDVLIYSAAGNNGDDVDAETCFIGCWEKYWWTPCEHGGVRCVGGLGVKSRNRDDESNFGHEDVDIFGPFHVLYGADPLFPIPSQVGGIKGTSMSAPYVAGVAALVWAANPSLDADQVDDAVMRNLAVSADPRVGKRVIQALSAVRDVLPPTVHITTPHDGQSISAINPTQFKANVFEDGLGTPTVTWTLNGTTVLGTGKTISALPPPGNHRIRATAVFPGGKTATDKIDVTVQNATPELTITGPAGGVFGQTEQIPFHATSLDDVGQLPDGMVRWFLDGSPNPFATGHNPVASLGATPGTHTVTVRGCDTFNLCGTDSITVTVIPDTANQPPVVRVLNPANGAKLWVNGNANGQFFHEITLNGSATDPEGGALTLVWRDNGSVIGLGLTPQVRLLGGCGDSTHSLTLTATDAAGNSRQDTVQVMVSMVC